MLFKEASAEIWQQEIMEVVYHKGL